MHDLHRDPNIGPVVCDLLTRPAKNAKDEVRVGRHSSDQYPYHRENHAF